MTASGRAPSFAILQRWGLVKASFLEGLSRRKGGEVSATVGPYEWEVTSLTLRSAVRIQSQRFVRRKEEEL